MIDLKLDSFVNAIIRNSAMLNVIFILVKVNSFLVHSLNISIQNRYFQI